FGIEPLAELGGTDHIAEQHRDRLSRLTRRISIDGQRRSTRVAEPRATGVRLTTLRAADHQASLLRRGPQLTGSGSRRMNHTLGPPPGTSPSAPTPNPNRW